MTQIPVALQMYTVRDFTRSAKDLAVTLAKVRSIGYEAVQLSAVGAMNGTSPEVNVKLARTMLDDPRWQPPTSRGRSRFRS